MGTASFSILIMVLCNRTLTTISAEYDAFFIVLKILIYLCLFLSI